MKKGEFISLTDEQICKYKEKFGKESIAETENKIAEIMVNKIINKDIEINY